MYAFPPVSMVAKPIQIEQTPAQLLLKTVSTSMDIETEKNGLNIKSNPVRLEIRNRAFFDSIGLESNTDILAEDAHKGNEAAMKAMARYAKEGKAMMGPHAISIAKIALLRTQKTIDSMLTLAPIEMPQLEWSGGDVDINFVPDKVNISWQEGEVEAKYIPYSINITVGK